MSQPVSREFRVYRLLLFVLLGSAIAGSVAYLQLVSEYAALFIASTIVLIVSCWLMQQAVCVFHLRHITIPNFWYLTYLVMIFIPSFFVFFSKEGSGRVAYLFGVQSVLITVPLGILFANKVFHFRTQEIRKYYESRLQETSINFHIFITCLLGFGAALGIMLLYVREVDTIPLFYMIRNPGNYETLLLLREDSFKLLDSPFSYLYYLLRALGFPFLIILTFGFYMVTKQRKWFTLFLFSFGSGMLYAAFSIAKAPVANIFLLMFLFLYLYWGGRITKWMFVIAPLLILLFPSAVLFGMFGAETDVYNVLSRLASRLFLTPAHTLYWYFELFPGSMDYLYGRSIGKLAWLMGWEYFDTPNYVGLYGLGANLVSVNANAAFIGNLNADFGLIGVLFGGIVVGIGMQTLHIIVIRQPKSILNLAVYTYLTFAFWLLHSTSLPIVLASNGVLLVLLLPWAIRIVMSVLSGATVPHAIR